jgi:hypothetical protein
VLRSPPQTEPLYCQRVQVLTTHIEGVRSVVRHRCGDDAVTLLHGVEFLTDDGAIELLPVGLLRLQQAHAAGRNAVIEVNGKLKVWLNTSFGKDDLC